MSDVKTFSIENKFYSPYLHVQLISDTEIKIEFPSVYTDVN